MSKQTMVMVLTEHGLEAGFDFACNQSTPSGIPLDPPLNPYLEG